MTWKSFYNELIGIFVCWLSGVFMGFICGINTQISSRGNWVGLGLGAGTLRCI